MADDDSRILALFREWVAVRRAAKAILAEDGDSAEYEAAFAVADNIERMIIGTPSSGAPGLAIKSYLSLHNEGGDGKDAAALGYNALNYEVDGAILKDIVRFVPEIASLAVRPLALIEAVEDAEKDLGRPLTPAETRLVETLARIEKVEERDDQPDVIGFGEPEERP